MGMEAAPLTGTRAPPREGREPVWPLGELLWAFVNDEVEARLSQGIRSNSPASGRTLRPRDCPRGIEPKSGRGDRVWVLAEPGKRDVEAIAPEACPGPRAGGGAEEMVNEPVPAKAGNLKAKVFAGRELRYVAVGEGGAKGVRVV